MRRRDGHTEARTGGGLATTQGVDPGTQLGIGREGQVEPFADAVGVETDELAVGIEERSARRSGSKRRRVLDAAVDLSSAGAAERPRDRRHEAERDACAATVTGAGTEDGAADGERRAIGPLERGRACRVDVDDREVAVAVPAGNGPARATAVSERDGDFVAAQVMGVCEYLARGKDDTGAARSAADPDDGWSGALGDRCDGGLEFFD